jgi:hypothetical protein
MSLKQLEIDGIRIQYEVFSDVNEFNGTFYWTEFYIGTKTITKRKYLMFGEKKTKEVPFKVFVLHLNIEDPSHTKGEIRALINRKLELLGRKAEIERGEIV